MKEIPVKYEHINWGETKPGDEIYEREESRIGIEYTGPYVVLDVKSHLLIHPEGHMIVFFGSCIFRKI